MPQIEIKATQHKVHSVTVFQANRAEVTRYFSVKLQAGQNDVDITQLPTVLDEDSIRVDGIGGSAVIADVIYHPPTSNDSDKKHEEAVKELQKKRDALQKKLEILQQQEKILGTYSDTLSGKDTTGEKLDDFLEIFAKRQNTINEGSTDLQEQLELVDKQIADEREVWSADNEGKKRAVRITVVVNAESDGVAELSLIYLVTNASWTPLYDLRAAIEAKKTSISLHYRATIVQSTGEDWKDIGLTLSTASPQLGSQIPKLSPVYVRQTIQHAYRKAKGGYGGSGAPPPPQVMMRSMAAPGSVGGFGADLDSSTLAAAFRPTEALAVEGAVSTSFIIEGQSNIPSDTDKASQAHKVSVAVIDLTADLEWIAVPKEQPSAFLRARVKNTSAYLLLPGRANIFLDDNFVAKSEISHVSPNESFNCSLGVDPQVKVTYHPRSKKTRAQGGLLLTTRTITFNYNQRITVKNTRSAAMKKLLVRDQIPISGEQRIKIALLEPAGLEAIGKSGTVSGSTSSNSKKTVAVSKGIVARWMVNDDDINDDASIAENDGSQEGLLEWVGELESGQSADLNLAWEVTVPAGLSWGPQ